MQIGVSITKRTAFRDSVQEFSNVYHYGSLDVGLTTAAAEGIIDEVAAQEKLFHGSGVAFIKGRLWSSGGTKEQNEMIAEKTLTGQGALAQASFDKERAILAQWKAGKDSRGRQVYLRKWYHVCTATAPSGAGTIGASAINNESSIPTNIRTSWAVLIGVLNRVGVTDQFGLVAESGRERSETLTDPAIHPYLEHRQMGDQWRQ